MFFYWNFNKNEYNKKFFKEFNDYIVFESDFKYLKYRYYKFIMISKNESQ